MNDIPTFIIITIAAILLFWIFKILSPIDITNFQTSKSLEVLRKKYMKYDLLSIGLLFLFTIILTFVYYNVFVRLSNLRISLLPNTGITVSPPLSAWILCSMFTAMLTSTILITAIYKWHLKDDYNEYTLYGYAKLGYSPSTASVVAKGFAVITAILVVLCLDSFTAFRQNDILFNSFFGLGSKTYQYTDIGDIRDVNKSTAPNGNIVDEEHYVIVFNDSLKWNSRKSGFGNFEENKKLVEWIEQKTGKQRTRLEFDFQ